MEITKISVWWTIISCIIIWLITASCVTDDRRADDIPGRRDLELVGQLEAEFSEFDRRIDRIEKTSGDIASDIDRIRELFAEYTRCIQQLRQRITEYKEQIERQGNTPSKDDNNPDNSGGSGNRG